MSENHRLRVADQKKPAPHEAKGSRGQRKPPRSPGAKRAKSPGMGAASKAKMKLAAKKSMKRWDPGHRKLKKRAKDVARVVRNHPRPEGKLSVRVNTDFPRTMALLREHHKDSWVGEKLQRVWEAMWKDGDMVVFELWYGPKLIAADIAHVVGKSFYVATRFFEQEYRKFQPGFLLALAETKVLAGAGFRLWDLGGTDSSPMMAYKQDITVRMSRPEFLARFAPLRGGRAAPLASGTVVEDIQTEHLILS
mmetsp:Transcript_5616/g.11142  ORF Transcript_5616/g.11142 Transcript_5616/m.11142 type:complete len:250 (+) Transcript_5616:73-822(+)